MGIRLSEQWQERPARMPSSRIRTSSARSTPRMDLLFVGIQERQTLGDVLVMEPCCKTLARLRAWRLGGEERRSLQDVQVRHASLSRWLGISSFRLRDIWSLRQTLPRLLRIDDEAGGGVPRPSVCTRGGGSPLLCTRLWWRGL